MFSIVVGVSSKEEWTSPHAAAAMLAGGRVRRGWCAWRCLWWWPGRALAVAAATTQSVAAAIRQTTARRVTVSLAVGAPRQAGWLRRLSRPSDLPSSSARHRCRAEHVVSGLERLVEVEPLPCRVHGEPVGVVGLDPVALRLGRGALGDARNSPTGAVAAHDRVAGRQEEQSVRHREPRRPRAQAP